MTFISGSITCFICPERKWNKVFGIHIRTYIKTHTLYHDRRCYSHHLALYTTDIIYSVLPLLQLHTFHFLSPVNCLCFKKVYFHLKASIHVCRLQIHLHLVINVTKGIPQHISLVDMCLEWWITSIFTLCVLKVQSPMHVNAKWVSVCES